MSPSPTTLHRHGFAHFDHTGLSAPMAESVLFARDRASSLLDQLRPKRDSIRANKRLSEEGKRDELLEVGDRARVEIKNLYLNGRRRADEARGNTTSRISSRLFGDVDKPALLLQAHTELLALAARDLQPAQLAIDGNGVALLSTGSPFHKLLERTLSTAPLAAAALATLAVLRSSPFLSTLIGGEAVQAAALQTLEARATEQDPEVASLVAERNRALGVLNVLKGDEQTALSAVSKSLGIDGPLKPAKGPASS